MASTFGAERADHSHNSRHGSSSYVALSTISIRSQLSSNARLKGFRRKACYLLVPAVITIGLAAQISPTASDLPTNERVIAFLTESIDWYRHCTIERQIATDPVDLVFLEDNRSVAVQIVQLSFDFARADAAVAATSAPDKQKGNSAVTGGSSPDLAQLVHLENNAELWERQASQEIETIRKKLQTEHGAERGKLQAALDAAQSRLDVSQAGLSTLQQMVEFMRTFAGHETGDLASSIEDLARTVPEVTSATVATPQMPNSVPSSMAKPPDSGILALSSQVSVFGQKLRILDDEILRTDKLRQSSDDLRTPLLASINKHLPALAENYPQASDLGELQRQKARVDELAALVKTLSPAIVASDKQRILLSAYTSHLKSWRAAVVAEDEKTWKTLISRLVAAAAVIAALFIIGAILRRATRHHMQESERRHIILIVQRVMLWFTIIVVTAFALASDLTSLATFFGLLAAGVAVALQSVIIAAFGYFLLVGKRGIRIGDRVEISGVTGDVIDIGWLQFQLREIDNGTQQPTGRVVTFSTAFVLASPGTGLSKLNRKDLKPVRVGAKAP